VRNVLLAMIVWLLPLSVCAETLHLKLQSLPLSIDISSPEWERESEYDYEPEKYTDRHLIKYKFVLSYEKNVLRVHAFVYRRHEQTIYEDGRREDSISSEREPEQLHIESARSLYPQKVITYEGKKTPYLSASNVAHKQDEKMIETLKQVPYGVHRFYYEWYVMFPNSLTKERVEQATLELNQGGGLAVISFPESEQENKSPIEISNYNLNRFFPFCEKPSYKYESYPSGRDYEVCLPKALHDFSKLDVISRQERISGQKMTPLQKKVFKKSKEYRPLLEEMKKQKKELGETLFCMGLKTGEYLLRNKGIEIEKTTQTDVSSPPPLSIRFFNLGKRVSKDAGFLYSGNPARVFLRVSEQDGLALEKKEVVGCFYPSKIAFKKGRMKTRYKGRFLYETYYHFVDVRLAFIYVDKQAYSVDKKGRVKKI